MKRCTKKDIRTLMMSRQLIIKIAILGIVSFVSPMSYAQKISDTIVPPPMSVIPMSPRFNDEDANKMIKKFVENGRCEQYYDCYCYSSKGSEALFYYAILMAEKYDCPEACYNVYWTIMYMSEKNKFEITENLWNLAFFYLNKAAEKGDYDSLLEMEALYRNGNKYVQPDKEKMKYYREKKAMNNGGI